MHQACRHVEEASGLDGDSPAPVRAELEARLAGEDVAQHLPRAVMVPA